MVSLLEKISTQEKKFSSEASEAVCESCGEKNFWWDKCGGGPHCQKCRPWPSRALVLKISGDEEKKQETNSVQDERRVVDVDDMTIEDFERYYRCYETRPDKDGNGVRLVIERIDWKPEWQMIDQ